MRFDAAHDVSEIEGDVVVVADDLTPAEAVRLGRENVRGFVLETGGRTSHTTIIARSLNLPLVCGLVGLTDRVTDEDPAELAARTLGRVAAPGHAPRPTQRADRQALY